MSTKLQDFCPDSTTHLDPEQVWERLTPRQRKALMGRTQDKRSINALIRRGLMVLSGTKVGTFRFESVRREIFSTTSWGDAVVAWAKRHGKR